jgi:CheY-like chemotaxis protein
MLNILVVEDNSADLFWLKKVLEEVGLAYALSVADDGQRAVDFLCKRGEFATAPTPDLILLDVHLPSLTGVEVLRSVAKAEQLPICVLTSSRAEQEVFKREFGIHGLRYLIKPVTPTTLRDCLRSIRGLHAVGGGRSR